MDRRDVLLTLACSGVLGVAPLAGVLASREQVAAETDTPLTTVAEHARLIAGIADAIIPRTDSPGATDVGVPQWIDVMLTEYYPAEERQRFLAGLDAIDALARRSGGVPFASLSEGQRSTVMAALDREPGSGTPAASSYGELKRLVVDGYFTSEAVQKDLLRVEVVPGRFDGCASLGAEEDGSGA